MPSDLILPVPYFSQRDSQAYGGQNAHRMCFSSTCAMLVNTLKPNTLKGPNGDDAYLQTVFKFGDTTAAAAQVKALAAYGIKAQFRQDLAWTHVDAQLAKGIPVPIGILHHGPVTAPTGGGHWLLVVGKTADGKHYVCNDPYGELSLVSGGYPGPTNGRQLRYSVKNLTPRWRVNGTGGWGILAQKP